MQATIKIGTRSSPLALWQTNHVVSKLKDLFPQLNCQVITIKTTGDKILDQSLSKIGSKGLFTREIEEQLYDGRIDLAVHSLKDMPTELPTGLEIAAIPLREDPGDVLICRSLTDIAGNPGNMGTIANNAIQALMSFEPGSEIMTGSLRRQCQILALRPDLRTKEVRGNIGTRLQKYQDSGASGIILAAAGLKRLGIYNDNCLSLPPREFLPACGQGALAIEIRRNDNKIGSIVKLLNHRPTELRVLAERSFLATMGGGCQVPMGAFAWLESDILHIRAMSGELNGQNVKYAQCSGPDSEAAQLGREVALIIKEGRK